MQFGRAWGHGTVHVNMFIKGDIMLAKRFLALALIAPTFLVGCTAPNGGAWPRQGVVSPSDARPAAQVVAAEGLTVSIATERTDFQIGEPIYLTLVLENSGQQSRRVVGSLDPIDGAVSIQIAAPDGKRWTFGPLAVADNDESIFQQLEPGTRIGGIVPIFFGAKGWTFTEPGQYVLTVRYQTPDIEGRVGETRSKPLNIDIHSSSVGDDLVGGDHQASVETGKFLTWQAGDHLLKGLGRLRTLMEKSSDSPLSSYAHAAFGHSLGEPFANYLEGKVRPKNCDLAMSHIESVVSTHVPDYIRLQNSITGASCALSRQDWRGAKRYLDQAKEFSGDRVEYRGIMERVLKFERYLETVEN